MDQKMKSIINKIRDTIETGIEISKDSGVPVLFIANPGLAKSTIVNNWALRNGYNVETLIGSRFTQEEILGFQVRIEDANKQYLELLEPYWYRNIIKHDEKNIPSLLFLDELSTVSENVQGAMLQLVFERTIGFDKKLPASTLVVAAANYKQNIPILFNIMAPILNRFCIVNLQYEDSDSFLNEFLLNEEDRALDTIVFKNINIDKNKKDKIRSSIKVMWKKIFESFKDQQKESLPIPLDINNQIYNNIYENDAGYVYNFLTGRTLHYLYRITCSCLQKGLTIKEHAKTILNMIFGLVGLGTNTFNDLQQKTYLKMLEKLYIELYESFESDTNAVNNKEIQNIPPPDFTGKNVSDAINEWLLYNESQTFYGGQNKDLITLVNHIKITYGQKEKSFSNIVQFVNDFQKIELLLSILKKENSDEQDADILIFVNDLTSIKNFYTDLYNKTINELF
ncbi:MAG: hypothetical protein Ta2F_06930 [Termitinemataceae bacterium]|nr:MAG: hypothetical protein Ta2F_06930 [Termitinemataceae bacterium]